LQREMDSFFREVNQDGFNIRKVTKGAFSKSRKNLKPEAFLELNDLVCGDFYENAPYLAYNGHRVLAIDGSTLALPNHPETKAEFGSHKFGPKADNEKSMARVSLLFDPANYMTVDAQLGSFDTSEKDLMLRHLDKVKPGDLLLMDRGYPSLFLFALLGARGIHFCVRMKDYWWKEVADFADREADQKEVVFTLSAKQLKEYKGQYPELPSSVHCRLVKVKLKDGNEEILCTSLLDQEVYPLDHFEEIYHWRWGEEEGYKMYKSRIGIEAFTGKTPVAIKQDIYAKVFMMSYCAAYAFPIAEKVKKEYAQSATRKHPQKINRTNAVANFRNIIVSLLLINKIDESTKAFDDNVFRTREIIRPNRKLPRNHKPKRSYYMNYKEL